MNLMHHEHEVKDRKQNQLHTFFKKCFILDLITVVSKFQDSVKASLSTCPPNHYLIYIASGFCFFKKIENNRFKGIID